MARLWSGSCRGRIQGRVPVWLGAKWVLNARLLLHNARQRIPARDAMPIPLKVWLMLGPWRQPPLRRIVRCCCTQVPRGLHLAVPAIMLLLHLRLLMPVRLRIGAKPSLSADASRLALHGEGSWGVAVLMDSKVLLLMRICLISQPRNACLVSHAGVSWQWRFDW